MMNELAFGRRMRNRLFCNVWMRLLKVIDGLDKRGGAPFCLENLADTESFGCKIIPDAVSVKSTILCYMLASLPFEDPIVISREES